MAAGNFQWLRWASSQQTLRPGAHSGWASAPRAAEPGLALASLPLSYTFVLTRATQMPTHSYPHDTHYAHTPPQHLFLTHTDAHYTVRHKFTVTCDFPAHAVTHVFLGSQKSQAG